MSTVVLWGEKSKKGKRVYVVGCLVGEEREEGRKAQTEKQG